MAFENHTRIAYVNSDNINSAIEQGKLDAYDICITKDTGEIIFINGEKQILPVRSRVYRYQSYEEALKAVNESDDTYEGQILSVWDDNQYAGYIVNTRNDTFQLDPLASPNVHLDYYDVKELTKAEYEALSDDEKNNGNIYLVTDEEPSTSETDVVALATGYGKLVLNPVNHIAQLIISAKAVTITTNRFVLGTIAEYYRPKEAFDFVCVHGSKTITCSVQTDGDIVIADQLEVSPYDILGNTTYLY